MVLTLITKENKKINVSKKEIESCLFINSMLTDYNEEDNYEIPIDVSYDIFKKILEFIEYENNNKETHLHEKFVFYEQYFTISDTILYEIMGAADYLNYEYLLDKACEKLSDDILKCDSIEDVKTKFKITKEFTEEEEQEILNFNKV